MASFIDDIIVEIEKKKWHDEEVEEVIKGVAENDLYIKLEKCKWKVKKVDLEVVIRLERIKIEEEKIRKILDWSQRYADLENNLDFSLYIVLSICYMVTISDKRKRSKLGVSADLVYCHLNTRDQVQ